jgi:Domain of unknown function (DUF4170)
MPFWVIGGEYTDTRFVDIVGGGAETRLGPFATYGDAKTEWARRAWASVDDAHTRWRIEEEGEQECAYWVVGGEYTDTGFTTPAGGQSEQRYGPFATYEEAKAEWARRAWATVDDAHTRYRIERRSRSASLTE